MEIRKYENTEVSAVERIKDVMPWCRGLAVVGNITITSSVGNIAKIFVRTLFTKHTYRNIITVISFSCLFMSSSPASYSLYDLLTISPVRASKHSFVKTIL